MSYYLLKHIHVFTVIVSISLFVFRGIGLLAHAGYLRWKWLKIVPHINDSILLLTAVYLAISLGQYPFVHHWLTVKVVALLIYIGLGLYLFKSAKSQTGKLLCFSSACLVFAFIVWTALSKGQYW